ncbi:MAG: type I glutamate--ammonia ligase [Myxococcota bacterium]|jgi:glutamine synthetase|nr:type I glutamate--ammonia ligase [Myxococcota bacterium]
MSGELERVRQMIDRRGVKMLDLRFTDLVGALHHITLPVSALSEKTFTHGVAFDASSVGAFKRVEGGDMVLTPLADTAFLDPFFEEPTLALLCAIREAHSGQPFDRDPRGIAQRAEAYLQSSGLAERSEWGPEFEFYVFDHVSSTNTNNRSSYIIDACEAHWKTGEEDKQHLAGRIRYQGGYHVMPPLDALHDLRTRAVLNIEACGIPVKYHHHEVGGAGQCEIEIDFLPMLAAADAVMNVKYLVKMTAREMGKTATFMPKPLANEAGSGMHFHQMLFQGPQPLFFDQDGYAQLSRTALHYIGGLLTHAPALCAITNPSTNSYRRLVPGFEAPTKRFFGLANRSAAIRIPSYARDPEEKRFELRPPDATCNPYIAMAAQLLAGIDGIQKEIDPTAAGFGPFDVDICRESEQVRAKLGDLPASLEEALKALQDDHAFLRLGEVFPADFVDAWVDYKMRTDVTPMRRRPHPLEIELYYDA